MPRTLLRRNLLDLRATISNSTSASLHTSRSSTRTRLAYRPFSSPPTNQATQQRHHRHYSTPTPQLTPSYHLRRTYSRNSLDARSRARSLERAQAQAHYPQRPPTRRCYASDSATADIQAPDHLSGAERSVFDKIKGELSPVRLEVHYPPAVQRTPSPCPHPSNVFPARSLTLAPPTGPRHIRRLRQHVRPGHRVPQIRGPDHDKTTSDGKSGAQGGD